MGGVSGRRRGRDEKHERLEAWGRVRGRKHWRDERDWVIVLESV